MRGGKDCEEQERKHERKLVAREERNLTNCQSLILCEAGSATRREQGFRLQIIHLMKCHISARISQWTTDPNYQTYRLLLLQYQPRVEDPQSLGSGRGGGGGGGGIRAHNQSLLETTLLLSRYSWIHTILKPTKHVIAGHTSLHSKHSVGHTNILNLTP